MLRPADEAQGRIPLPRASASCRTSLATAPAPCTVLARLYVPRSLLGATTHVPGLLPPNCPPERYEPERRRHGGGNQDPALRGGIWRRPFTRSSAIGRRPEGRGGRGAVKKEAESLVPRCRTPTTPWARGSGPAARRGRGGPARPRHLAAAQAAEEEARRQAEEEERRQQQSNSEEIRVADLAPAEIPAAARAVVPAAPAAARRTTSKPQTALAARLSIAMMASRQALFLGRRAGTYDCSAW